VEKYPFRAYLQPKTSNREEIIRFLGERAFLSRTALQGKSWFRISQCSDLILNDEVVYFENGIGKEIQGDLNPEFDGLASELKYALATSLHNPQEKSRVTDLKWDIACSNLNREFSQKFIFYPESYLFLPAKHIPAVQFTH